MKEWTKERCSEEPQELQLVADGIYIQRKNIKKVQHEATEGMEAYTCLLYTSMLNLTTKAGVPGSWINPN